MNSKKLFNIFRHEILNYGDGHVENHMTKVGQTWAVSKKQAASNYRFRNGVRDEFVPWSCDGYRETTYVAEVA